MTIDRQKTGGQKTGGQLLVECLAAHGVTRISSVAGESYLAVLDALVDYPEIALITCRQEGGAAYIAESWGKLTGAPGICFVTRGPGACNASIGVHTAMQDSTPMILFMGQVRREEKNREAFQEIDVRQVFSGLAKWATEIDDPARIPEIISRAFTVALSGRPGPVVIGLPEDMLREETGASSFPAAPLPLAAPSKGDMEKLKDMLESARRPTILLGGSGWTDDSCAHIDRFASTCHLPVIASFRRQDLFDHHSGNYAGELGTGPNPALVEKLAQADLLIVIGARLNEITTQGYTLPPVSQSGTKPNPKIIHIHPDAGEIGKVYRADLGIVSDLNIFAETIATTGFRIDGRGWAAWKDEFRVLYEDWTAIDLANRPQWQGADMTAIFAFLRERLSKDAIITTDAGNFSGWAQRYLRYGRPGRLLAPISGAMGYAVPAAIGASLAAPDKTILGICGDGGFMMNGQEIATAIHHGAKPIIMVCNNGLYGTIRMHQERAYPGRHSATDLTNPDFVKLAESYGAYAARVTHADAFPDIWESAQKAGTVSLIEIAMDPRQITTGAII